MARFTFTVTRDVTESCSVTVEANSIEEAHDRIRIEDTEAAATCTDWELDDNSNQLYIPDEDDYTVEE